MIAAVVADCRCLVEEHSFRLLEVDIADSCFKLAFDCSHRTIIFDNSIVAHIIAVFDCYQRSYLAAQRPMDCIDLGLLRSSFRLRRMIQACAGNC